MATLLKFGAVMIIAMVIGKLAGHLLVGAVL